MIEFQKIITVCKTDIDHLNHVNNIKYIEWVNDIGEAHWKNNTSEEIRSKYFWILIAHHIKYKSECHLNDQLKIVTYVKKSFGLKSTRVVEFHNLTRRKLAAISETTWCFMDQTTKKPTKITDELKSLFE